MNRSTAKLHSKCRAERLNLLLDQNNCTPQQLSIFTDIPMTTIRQYLRGARDTISTRNLFFIAKFFDMPIVYLIDFLDEVKKPSE